MRRHIYYTLQSLLHKQGSNAIKIVSLALGLLMSVFLFARIAFELSFDNFYHDSDNLYIVKTGWLKNGVLEGNESRFTIIPIPAAIAEEFPEQVESSTVSCSLFDNSFQLGERQLDMSTVMADTLYFSVLGLEMIEGNPQDLAGPDVVFLSAKSAKEAFGDENPIGKTLRYDFWGISDYTAREGYLCRYSVEHFFGEASRGNHFLSYYRAASEVEPRLAKRRKLRRLSQAAQPAGC